MSTIESVNPKSGQTIKQYDVHSRAEVESIIKDANHAHE
jgi:acyl-CoA reductase-like NAD-dependent aldehyde dehydrogenase